MNNTKESNQIRKEIFDKVIADLKKDFPLLSEEEIRIIEVGFYSGTEKYLFKRKGK